MSCACACELTPTPSPPLFLSQPYNEGGNPPYNAAGLAYASNFQAAVRSALGPLPTSEQAGSAIFSSACFHHCVTQEPSYWAIRVYNVSFRDLSAAWYFQDMAPLKYVEQCDGYKCGTCRSHRKHPGAPPDPRPKPPRSPAPPDPFAVWSPPPPPLGGVGRVGAATVALPGAKTSSKSGSHARRWALLAGVLLAMLVGYQCVTRRVRQLRAIPVADWSEGQPLIPSRPTAGGARGGAPAAVRPYPAAGGTTAGPSAAAAALSAFRSDSRYAKPPSAGEGGGGAGMGPSAPAGRPARGGRR